MVLVGIATVAAIGIPLWFQQPSITLQRAADLLVNDMLGVQENAIVHRMASRIEFNGDGGGYKALEASGMALPAPMGNGPYIRDFDQDAVFDGVLIEEADFGGQRSIEFGQDGYAVHDGHVVLSFRGETRRVVFDANEAYVVGDKER